MRNYMSWVHLVALTCVLSLPSTLLAAELPWADLLKVLQDEQSESVRNMSKQDRVILQAQILLNMHQHGRAMKLLANQSGNPLVTMLKVEADHQRRIAAVRRAGGSLREVHMDFPAGYKAAMNEVDARLNTFINSPQVQPVATKNLFTAFASPDDPSEITEPAIQAPSLQGGEDAQLSPAVRSAVQAALETWYTAWSNRDLDTYFSAYADDFDVSEHFQNISAWKKYKKWAITKHAFIAVRVKNITMIAISSDTLRVQFLQYYRSDTLNTDALKTLVFRQTPNGWKIIHESISG